jgi:tRNA (cytidine/uridine-2'-O-)-methyltransferase
MHIVLFRPEIPPNTGNAMRLVANTGTHLHLIHPLGFSLDEARLRRAGLDYKDWADVSEHPSLDAFVTGVRPERTIAFTRNATIRHTDIAYRADDALLFGPESDGLPEEILASDLVTDRVRIPMKARSRSLNLSNSVAIATYEALRQQGFPGLE